MDESAAFLGEVFGDATDYYTLIWTLPDKVSRFCRGWQFAAREAGSLAITKDVYVGVGLFAQPLGAHQRGTRNDVVGVAGFWADIDYDDPAHKKGNLPPNEAAATALLETMPLRHTLLVHSGHGLQAWWLFVEPYIFDSPEDRERVQAVVAGWNDLLKAKAQARGWDVDSTWDLTRILRVPGTMNRKVAGEVKPVRLLTDDGPRYSGPSDFVDYVDLIPRPQPHVNGTHKADSFSFTVDPSADPPFSKWRALQENEPKFRASWDRRRRDLQDQSSSGYCQSLATLAVIAGWSDQEIVNLLVAWRREQREEPKRPDWYARTIVTARRGRQQDDAMSQLISGEVDGDDREGLLEMVRQALGVPIAAWVKCGQDRALYSMRLDDGSEVSIGAASVVLSPTRFRTALFDANYMLPVIKAERWQEIAKVLIQIAEEVDSGESTRAARVQEWIDGYLSRTPPRPEADWEIALLDNQPFSRSDAVFIHAGALRRYAIFTLLERVEHAEVIDMLRAAGFRRQKLSARIDGKVVTRNYWSSSALLYRDESEKSNLREAQVIT